VIVSEIQACSSCGHPVREKEGGWKHTNTMDGHVFSTKACQQCIAEGKDCREASPSEGARVSIQEIPVVPPEKKASEEQYVICSICGIYAKSKAALMRHYRDEHPLDPEELLRLKREGKTVEEMAAILQRTEATIEYHIEKLTENTLLTLAKKTEGPSEAEALRLENSDLKKALEDLQKKIQERSSGWTRVFHLESSGEGASEGVTAIRNVIKSTLPYFPLSISLDVDSNKELHSTRIFVEVRTK